MLGYTAMKRQPFVTVITTNATLRQDSLRSQLSFLPQLAMITGAEAHYRLMC